MSPLLLTEAPAVNLFLAGLVALTPAVTAAGMEALAVRGTAHALVAVAALVAIAAMGGMAAQRQQAALDQVEVVVAEAVGVAAVLMPLAAAAVLAYLAQVLMALLEALRKQRRAAAVVLAAQMGQSGHHFHIRDVTGAPMGPVAAPINSMDMEAAAAAAWFTRTISLLLLDLHILLWLARPALLGELVEMEPVERLGLSGAPAERFRLPIREIYDAEGLLA